MLLEPKLLATLREGYSLALLRVDALAGLTVAVVALPLAMALAIASGTTPDKGLHTAIVAGFLISALGGSRVQIGGPTAAFIPVVFSVIQRFGTGGLILCTLLAGILLVVAGLLRLGVYVRRIPHPVVVGFSAGIAVSIVTSQVKDALGLQVGNLPLEFLARWRALLAHLSSTAPAALLLTATGLALILGLRRWRPHWPGFLIALLVCTLLAFALPSADTIGSRFGALPSALPSFAFPVIPFERTLELLPSALAIAFLAGIESLLSAVVADGMTGGRHRASAELVAQGVANIGSALAGGLPATGAIARTATNIRAGARTPVAGMLHALFLLLFLLLLAPWMGHVPLAGLAAILLVVAWNVSEHGAFRRLLGERGAAAAVLLATFLLTVLFDLTVGILGGLLLHGMLWFLSSRRNRQA
jgi:SulP family sulfate permease